MASVKANFFIPGAPRCGTTSLADWLSGHPDMFVMTPGDPTFFNTDYDLQNRPRTLGECRRILSHIGMRDDGRAEFHVRNIGWTPGSAALSMTVRAHGRLRSRLEDSHRTKQSPGGPGPAAA